MADLLSFFEVPVMNSGTQVLRFNVVEIITLLSYGL